MAKKYKLLIIYAGIAISCLSILFVLASFKVQYDKKMLYPIVLPLMLLGLNIQLWRVVKNSSQ